MRHGGSEKKATVIPFGAKVEASNYVGPSVFLQSTLRYTTKCTVMPPNVSIVIASEGAGIMFIDIFGGMPEHSVFGSLVCIKTDSLHSRWLNLST